MMSPRHDTGWFKSSRSGAANEGCVEVRITDVAVGVRDSTNHTGSMFSVPTGAWVRFVAGARTGRFS